MSNRYRFFDDETVQQKTKKYTKPHPIVTTHLRNLQSRTHFTNVGTASVGRGILSNNFIPNIIGAIDNRQVFLKPSANLINGFPVPQVRIQNPGQSTQPPSPQVEILSKKRQHPHFINDNDASSNKKKRENEHGKYTQFTDELNSFCDRNRQSDKFLQSKLHLRDALLAIFRREFQDCSLHLVGSSCNGFATNSSDADFCLMLCHYRNMDRNEALFCLGSLQRLLRKYSFLKKIQFIRAKVPILKFTDSVSGCECDININNSIGIRNTHLLRSYSKIDRRVSPLVALVKHWAKSRKINDASQGTLSSYSLVLMAIHYLQSACQPPILMSLQEEYPKYFDYSKNVDELPMFEPADHIDCNSSENKMSLGELIEGFFSYFAKDFNFDYLAVSVRLGRAIPKQSNPDFISKYICVEEPFERTNTARAVYEYSRFQLIKREFLRADEQLKKKLSLNSIM